MTSDLTLEKFKKNKSEFPNVLELLPVFIINLMDSSDRREFMKTQCENLGVSPVFIDAVYGKDLTNSDIEKHYNQKEAKQLFGRDLLLGEIGCALSHKKVYQKIADENIPYAVILEDDALIKNGFIEVIKLTLDSDVNWELVLLGHHKNAFKGICSPLSVWEKAYLDSVYTLNRLADFGFGTYGYIISNKGANKLLSDIKNISRPIDHYTCDSNIINVYAIFPIVVEVNYDFDNIIDNRKTRTIEKNKIHIKFLKKIGFLDKAVSIKIFLKTLIPIRKYK